ncbi:MAG: alpha/beta fold hydrolase [Jatrophihabitantaceae bacterium]
MTSDDGTDLAVEVIGETNPGPTVVFIHGWTLSSRFWHYQRDLAHRYRVVLMDHRGHGESAPGPRENRTVDQLGRDLKAVLEATCAGRDVVLVGHSMGGMTIMSLAAQYPDLIGTTVRGVALLDTSARREVAEYAGLRGRLARAWAEKFEASLTLMAGDPARAEAKRRPGSAISVAMSRLLNLAPKADKRLGRFTEAMSAQTAVDVIGDFWATLSVHDKVAALDKLGAVPTLVLVGDKDRLTPPGHAYRIAAAVAGSRLVVLRGAGHCAPLEQPGAVNAALTDLVAEARPDQLDDADLELLAGVVSG